MNSNDDCQTRQETFFDSTPKPGKLIFSLTIPGRLPSWNAILAMEHWQRYKEKRNLADVFLFALKLSERDCSTTTTPAPSGTLIYSATLALYLTTAQERRALKSHNKKLKLASEKKSVSKCTKSKVPF